MIKICLQSGHDGKAGAGAPNESATNKRITDRLATVLRLRGFEVTQTNYYAFQDPNVTKVDFALFLALHCDMDYPNDLGSGFADYPEPSTDGATVESQRITSLVNQSYFPEVGITYKNRSNANTRYYYMWSYLTAKTPCVLIEMGQSVDAHDSVLLANTDLIANALGRAICKAFNVSFDISPIGTPIGDTLLSLKAEIETLKGQLDTANKSLIAQKTQSDSALAVSKAECKKKLDDFKASLLKIINETI